MEKLASIHCDLDAYQIRLSLRGHTQPLVVLFDTPSRRFYFSMIVLIVMETKKLGRPGFVHIHKHQKILTHLDQSLSGKHASRQADGMWAKINMAWRHRLPDLESAALFKVLDRDLIAPSEKGGKFRYQCSDAECDAWANLFGYDEKNKWRLKFAVDTAGPGLDDIRITSGNLRGAEAWKTFLAGLHIKPETADRIKPPLPRWRSKSAFVLLAAILILGAGAWAAWRFAQPAPPPPLALPDKPSIAVLPFKNMSDNQEQDFFSDGIAEEIISALSSVPDLFVIARNSTFAYKGKAVNVQRVGEELGVQYILEGSVRKSGERIRITSQLIDALSGRHLWAQRFDRHLGDILAVQDEITRNVITSVQIALTEGEQVRAAGAGTESLDAYLAYLQAIKNIRFFTVQGNALGRRLARKAIELDPNYAVAYRALAITHSMDVWLGTSQSPKQSLEECMALLRKAIELDPDYADAHSSLGFTLTMLGRHQEAIAAAERGVALNPNSAEAYALLANALRFAGRPRDAIAMYNKAIRLNPIPPAYYFFGLGHACSMNGQHEQAVRWCQKAVRSAPDNFLAHLTATVVFSKAGREADARDSALQVLRVNPGYSLAAHEKRATMIGKEAYFEALRKSGLQ